MNQLYSVAKVTAASAKQTSVTSNSSVKKPIKAKHRCRDCAQQACPLGAPIAGVNQVAARQRCIQVNCKKCGFDNVVIRAK